MLDRGLQRLRSAGVQNIVDPVLRHTTPQSLQIGAGVRMRLAEDDVIGVDAPVDRAARRDQRIAHAGLDQIAGPRSEDHTSELQSLMRLSSAAICLKKQN